MNKLQLVAINMQAKRTCQLIDLNNNSIFKDNSMYLQIQITH